MKFFIPFIIIWLLIIFVASSINVGAILVVYRKNVKLQADYDSLCEENRKDKQEIQDANRYPPVKVVKAKKVKDVRGSEASN